MVDVADPIEAELRILITTSSDKNTLAACYQKHLSVCPGVQIIPAYTFDIEEKPTSRGLHVRVMEKIFRFQVMRRSTSYLLEEVRRAKPDVVVIIKGAHISEDAVHELARSGIKMINYNPDHPIHFDSPASGNENIRRALRHYHVVYTYSPEIQKDIMLAYPSLNVKVLPFGFEASTFNSNDLRGILRMNKVCFAGTADRERREAIKSIIDAGFSVDVYGRKFDRIKSRNMDKLRIFPSVSGEAYNRILQAYDAQLNLFRNQNRNSHNMRTFEIPSVGGIQVSPYSDQCAQFFQPDLEIFMYADKQSLFTKLEHLLSQSNAQQLEYRHATRTKCLTADYSYAHRARQMVEDIKTL